MKFSFERREEQHGQRQPGVFHRERRFAKRLLLLLELDLGLHDVALRDLAEPLLLLRDVEKALRLLRRLLRGRVLALGRRRARSSFA